jgi:hypothetical protein
MSCPRPQTIRKVFRPPRPFAHARATLRPDVRKAKLNQHLMIIYTKKHQVIPLPPSPTPRKSNEPCFHQNSCRPTSLHRNKRIPIFPQSFTHRNNGQRCTLREYDAQLPRPPAVTVTGSVLGREAASLTSCPPTTSRCLQFYPTPKSNFLQSPALSLALCYENCCKEKYYAAPA